MRRLVVLFLCLGVVVGGLAWIGIEGSAQAGDNFGFGKRIAGIWLFDDLVYTLASDPENPISAPTWRALATVEAGGTGVMGQTDDLSVDDGFVETFRPALVYAWERTGRRQIEVEHASLQVDQNDELVGIYVGTAVVDFSPDLRSGEATGVIKFFGPTEDPLEDPGTVVWWSTYRLRRF